MAGREALKPAFLTSTHCIDSHCQKTEMGSLVELCLVRYRNWGVRATLMLMPGQDGAPAWTASER